MRCITCPATEEKRNGLLAQEWQKKPVCFFFINAPICTNQPMTDSPPMNCCKPPWIFKSLPVVTNYLDAGRKNYLTEQTLMWHLQSSVVKTSWGQSSAISTCQWSVSWITSKITVKCTTTPSLSKHSDKTVCISV